MAKLDETMSELDSNAKRRVTGDDGKLGMARAAGCIISVATTVVARHCCYCYCWLPNVAAFKKSKFRNLVIKLKATERRVERTSHARQPVAMPN